MYPPQLLTNLTLHPRDLLSAHVAISLLVVTDTSYFIASSICRYVGGFWFFQLYALTSYLVNAGVFCRADIKKKIGTMGHRAFETSITQLPLEVAAQTCMMPDSRFFLTCQLLALRCRMFTNRIWDSVFHVHFALPRLNSSTWLICKPFCFQALASLWVSQSRRLTSNVAGIFNLCERAKLTFFLKGYSLNTTCLRSHPCPPEM